VRLRELQAGDEEILRAAYLARGFEGGWKPLSDVVAAVVVADDDDRPINLVAAHLVADVRTVVDQSFSTPAVREMAVIAAHDALMEQLRVMGITKASALLEGAVGRGFGKRMQRKRGWVPSRGIAYERETNV
jgi:hypothetical protein